MRSRLTEARFAAGIAATTVLVLGVSFHRPELVILALPLVLWVVLVSRAPVPNQAVITTSAAEHAGQPVVTATISGEGEALEVDVQVAPARGQLVVAPGQQITIERTVRHSGPTELATITARELSGDASEIGRASQPTLVRWNVAPAEVSLSVLPVPRHLRGTHGTHAGIKRGSGGDFRDLAPYVAGDDTRRIDWRATARAARGSGELMLRRYNAESDANFTIAVDNTENLSALVRMWRDGDVELQGVTSLDNAREAADAIARAAQDGGDRVGYLELVPGGRTVRSGSGQRHIARVRAAIAATSSRAQHQRARRTPLIASGGTVFVLATFVDPGVSELVEKWHAAGHRVVAVDVLPELDESGLNPSSRVALRIVHAERKLAFQDFASLGIPVVRWRARTQRDAVLRIAARGQ